MSEKKETTLNEAIIKIKVELQEKKLKQSGKNTFAGFTYFELSDFLPTLNKLMQENGVNDQIIINRDYKWLNEYNKNNNIYESSYILSLFIFLK